MKTTRVLLACAGWGPLLFLFGACVEADPADEKKEGDKDSMENGGAGPSGQGGAEANGGDELCQSDRQCQDDSFCNGRERCRPASEQADRNGCIASQSDACGKNECDEEAEECSCENPDQDGDGQDSLECGGTDCDDMNRLRFAGNVEVCDAEDLDEDCDPLTFGYRDRDGDEFPDALCCNENEETGERTCGTDCDDTSGIKHPFNTETCDDIDNDCDLLVDETPDGEQDDGLKTRFVLDEDGDGFGSSDPQAKFLIACLKPEGYQPTASDCDDKNAEINPGAFDSCEDELDNDCSGTKNDPLGGCDCEGNSTQTCGPGGAGLTGKCATFERQCNNGRWDDCPLLPQSEAEICDGNGIDENCDSYVDEAFGEMQDYGLRTACYPDLDQDGFAPAGAAPELACGCGSQQTSTEPSNGQTADCSDDPALDEDAANKTPNKNDVCNGIDDDCDGDSDNDPNFQTTYYLDEDGDGFGLQTQVQKWCPGSQDANYTDSTVFDCNDDSAAISPSATELCNNVDDNCNDEVDEDPAVASCGSRMGHSYACQAGGVCSITQCPAETGNCDNDYQTGCSTSLRDNLNDCGGCGQSCRLECVGLACDDIVSIASGSNHACAIRQSQRVVCWGDNTRGQLGDGTTSQRTSPVEVGSLTGVVALALGATHSCALQSDGDVYCWGDNKYGQTGQSPTSDAQTTPQPVSIANVLQLDAGGASSCAVSTQGQLSCWGSNEWGQLGNNSTEPAFAPQPVLDPSQPLAPGTQLSDASVVAVGARHACAIRSDDTVVCWGDNLFRQLGDGLSNHGDSTCLAAYVDCSRVPVTVSGISDATALSVGPDGQHSCVLAAGDVSCWGDNALKKAADTSADPLATPSLVLENVSALAVGNTFSCSWNNAGGAQCWGSHAQGQLAKGAPQSGAHAPAATTFSDLASFAAGDSFGCAVLGSGAPRCWGADDVGQLGNGGADDTSGVPTAVGSL